MGGLRCGTCLHPKQVGRIGIRGAESVVICWTLSVNIGMSTGADTCQYPIDVWRISIRDTKSIIACQHMSYPRCQERDCQHMSPHVGTYQQMSTFPQMATHDSIQTKSKWLVPEVPRVILHVGKCWHLSTHVGTCQCMSACFQVLAHIRTSRNAGTWIRSKWLDGLNFEGIAAPTLVLQVKKVEWQNNLATNVIEWDKYVIIHHLSMQPAYIPMINLLVI